MIAKTLIVGLAAAVLLSGCARNTDASSAGFVNGILNQVDGTYANEREQLRSANEASAAQNEQIAANNSRLEGERAQLEQDTAYSRRKLTSLRSSIARTKRDNAASSAAYKEAQRREARLDELERDVEAGNKAGDANRVSEAARALARIDREIID